MLRVPNIYNQIDITPQGPFRARVECYELFKNPIEMSTEWTIYSC